ncbi:MAG: hypothetical protein IH989_02135 [Planctomycetes bacterium]|nr:hypothetical protein [Planctomycetota bacterium]
MSSANETDVRPDLPKPNAQTVHWIIAVLLAVIATALWSRPSTNLIPAAFGQGQPLAGARGVYAFTGQLDHNRYGLFMLDIDQGTIWAYEIENSGGTRKMRLIAARTWIYDRYLQDFNSASPSFRMVQELVALQRTQAEPDAAADDDQQGDGRTNASDPDRPGG